MKILYITNTFPVNPKDSTIYTDLAEALQENGYELTVVASGEKSKLPKTTVTNERFMKVIRIRIGDLYNVSLIKKGITTLRIKNKLINGMKKYLPKQKFDLILFESPPVSMHAVITWAKKFYNAPSLLMLKDIFPQNAVDLGIIKKNSLIHKYYVEEEKKLYKSADFIGCMSPKNIEYVKIHNPSTENKLLYFPNTKKMNVHQPSTEKEIIEIKKKYKIPLNSIVAMYGGNMGKPQGIDFVIKVLKKFKNNEKIFFLLVGRGTEKLKLESVVLKSNMQNILILDHLPREDYERMLKASDLGLIFLDYRFSIPNFPSRVLSYFEYKIPVIAAVDSNNDFVNMIEESKAGHCVVSNNTSDFEQVLNKMIDSKEDRIEMGINGELYMKKNYEVQRSVDIINQLIFKINK